MENKTKWVVGIILVIVILIVGVWIFSGKDKVEEKVVEEKQNVSGNLTNFSSQPLLSPGIMLNPPYDSIDSLNKSGCLNIEQEYFKSLCINGIDLIEKAIAANSTEGCFDNSISVNTRIRTMCLQKLTEIKNKEDSLK